jgi:hypothetical protein
MSTSVKVNVDNFARAETARMFDAGLAAGTSGFNAFSHARAPAAVDNQPVIRMNRDTLYSSALVNISAGATVSLPEAGDRYMSMMVLNEDHYLNRIYTNAGAHELTVEEFGTPFVGLVVRMFVDPNDPGDVQVVNGLQDELALHVAADEPFSHPDYDETSLSETRAALLALAEGLDDTHLMFGSAEEVEPVRHLLGTALGWGGLPEYEAFYVIRTEPNAAAHYRMTLRDVPVDGFWSVSVYNRDGFFEPNAYGRHSVNSVTARPGADGSVTIDLAPVDDSYDNHLYVMDGWNYALRLYRPHAEVLDGTWTPPEPALIQA